MSGLSPTRKNALLLVALLFGHLVLLSNHGNQAGGAALLERGVLRATSPLVDATGVAGAGAAGVAGRLAEIRTARSENQVLRDEVERLRFDLGRHREEAAENERLRRLLEMRTRLAPRSVGAAVVAANLAGQIRMIVIDRGLEDGVRPDLPVVAWGGAVGRVVSTDRRLAKVRLLNDPNGGAAGLVQRSRAQGMVVGRGDAPMTMLYVPAYEDVVQGDRVVTSGKDGVFPRGFTIGRVVSVGKEPGVSKSISVQPEVDFSALEEVLVLLDTAEMGTALAGPEGP
jgi:rod shape-determining protein MreC